MNPYQAPELIAPLPRDIATKKIKQAFRPPIGKIKRKRTIGRNKNTPVL